MPTKKNVKINITVQKGKKALLFIQSLLKASKFELGSFGYSLM